MFFIIMLMVGIGGAAMLYAIFRQPAPAPLPIVIAQFDTPVCGLLHIAQAKGYLVEEGLNATIKIMSTGVESVAQVLRGGAAVGASAETPIALALAQGKQIRVIATIFSSRGYFGFVARKDRGIATPADMAGKRVGFVFGTSAHFQLETFLAYHHVPLDAVTMVPLKPDALVAALVAGQVDAISTWTPHMSEAEQQLGNNARTFLPTEFYPQMINLVVRADYVEHNREVTDRLLRALFKAESFAKTHADAALDIVAAQSGVLVSELRRRSDSFTYELSLKQPLLLAMETEIRWAFRRGVVADGPFPDVLHAFETEPLRAIKPAGVTISR